MAERVQITARGWVVERGSVDEAQAGRSRRTFLQVPRTDVERQTSQRGHADTLPHIYESKSHTRISECHSYRLYVDKNERPGIINHLKIPLKHATLRYEKETKGRRRRKKVKNKMDVEEEKINKREMKVEVEEKKKWGTKKEEEKDEEKEEKGKNNKKVKEEGKENEKDKVREKRNKRGRRKRRRRR